MTTKTTHSGSNITTTTVPRGSPTSQGPNFGVVTEARDFVACARRQKSARRQMKSHAKRQQRATTRVKELLGDLLAENFPLGELAAQ